MQSPNRAELKAALVENERQIKQAVAHLSKLLSNEDWQSAFDEVIKLRKVHADIERTLKALIE